MGLEIDSGAVGGDAHAERDGHSAPPVRGGAAPTAFYRAMRSTVRTALRGFYGRIEVTGTENRADAPTILASNHPNSIVDPLMVAMLEERGISFCARDGLFKIPLFGGLLRAVGAIPIRRRSDHGGDSVDNQGAFAACRAVLERGGVLSIFPEGKTHERMRIEPLRTGVARIALDAEPDLAHPLGVKIVPVGLNYLVRHAFRSDVHVAYGTPIDVAAEFGELAKSDPKAAVRALTSRIEEALRAIAVHVEREDDERLIAQVTAIVVGIRADEGLDEGGQSPAERTALVRRVVDAYKWLTDLEPEYTVELRGKIEQYMDARARLGLGGETAVLQHRGERRRFRREGQRRLALLVAGAPIAGLGLLSSAVPYLLLRVALKVSRASKDRIALVKLVGGAVLFGSSFAAQTALVATIAGAVPAALYAATLLPTTLFARWYLTEARLHRLNIRSALGFWRHADDHSPLRAERKRLQAELADLRRRYLSHLERAPVVT